MIFIYKISSVGIKTLIFWGCLATVEHLPNNQKNHSEKQ